MQRWPEEEEKERWGETEEREKTRLASLIKGNAGLLHSACELSHHRGKSNMSATVYADVKDAYNSSPTSLHCKSDHNL